MNQLQSKLVEMMNDIAYVLETNKIRYFICGGTLLGAIRHQGFIPWDDDIDIAIPREDYNKLLSKFNELFIDYKKYELKSIELNSDYPFPYAKIYDSQTTVVEDYKKPIIQGVYIDIFPIDGIDYTKAKKLTKKFKLLTRIYMYKFGAIDISKLNFISNLGAKVLSIIFTKKYLRKKIISMMSTYDFNTASHVIIYPGRYRIREVFNKETYQEVTKLQFENIKVFGIKDFDKYLSQIYGSKYMEMPPLEKRKTHHMNSYVNLELSYREYRTSK